jgi:hypothetical protein
MDQERDVPTETLPLTPAVIWREMTTDRRLAAAHAFWTDEESVAQQIEAVQVIARQLHFRPQSVVKMPPEKLARHLAAVHKPPESVAARLLVVYHLAGQRPMLEAFLDHLGMAHDHGLISEPGSQAPDAAALQSAADALRAGFPERDVRLYFRTLAAQDPETWGGLAAIVSAWPVS